MGDEGTILSDRGLFLCGTTGERSRRQEGNVRLYHVYGPTNEVERVYRVWKQWWRPSSSSSHSPPTPLACMHTLLLYLLSRASLLPSEQESVIRRLQHSAVIKDNQQWLAIVRLSAIGELVPAPITEVGRGLPYRN